MDSQISWQASVRGVDAAVAIDRLRKEKNRKRETSFRLILR
jgi:hypothetical protein